MEGESSLSDIYDVFLSYHWRDQREVKALAEQLQARGATVFLDRWYLTPGKAWPQELERALSTCRAVAVCLGPSEMGPWQQRERNFALDRQAKDPHFPLIPILLPGADPALSFLSQNTWIDLRAGVAQPLLIAMLLRALRGEPPGPELQKRLKETLTHISPYKGLAFFREEDAPFFFGRQAAIDTLANAVSKRHFVAVVGSSGSGKSSVVRAGLVPHIRRDTYAPWEIVTLVPNDRPLYNLAAVLTLLLNPDLSETDQLIEIKKQADALATGALRLRDVIERILAKQPGTARCLLIVDQWEELYTLTTSDDERRRFIDNLLEAAAAKAVSVVLTLRGDFVGHALAYRPLSDRCASESRTDAPRRAATRYRTTCRQSGGDVRSGSGHAHLGRRGRGAGESPLLAFVLQRLWEDAVKHNSRLRHHAYETMGGVQGALANAAEAAYERLSNLEASRSTRLLAAGAARAHGRRHAPPGDVR